MIVVTGRQVEALHNILVFSVGYQMRAYAFVGLVYEEWPSFSNRPDGTRRRPAAPDLPRRARTRPNDALGRRHRVALGRPVARLAGGEREAADELGAQVLGLDDRVDDELRGEMQDVDVLGVLGAQLLDLGGPLPGSSIACSWL